MADTPGVSATNLQAGAINARAGATNLQAGAINVKAGATNLQAGVDRTSDPLGNSGVARSCEPPRRPGLRHP